MVPTDPNYVPSVYPWKDSDDNEDDTDLRQGSSSVKRFQRAQRRHEMTIEQQRSLEEEEKVQQLQLQRIQGAFNHDHGLLFRHTKDARVGILESLLTALRSNASTHQVC